MRQQNAVTDSITNTSCVCCLSNKILSCPLGPEGYFYCPNCGLVFKTMDAGYKMRDSLISHYEHVDPHELVANLKQSFFNSALDCLSSQIKGNKKSILDVGCGFGYFLELAARKGWAAYGVETVSAAVKSAERKAGNKNIFHGTLREAQYPDNSFDVITLWDILFIVENPFDEVRECYRVLKEGGKIGIRVRNIVFQEMAYRIYLSLKKINSKLGMKRPYVFHQYCFSKKSMYHLLCRVGFINVRITNSPLTKGDPYGYDAGKRLIMASKTLVDIISRLVFFVGGGRWVVGPSLLVWADKPKAS